ncbi:MAG: hypothetical protein JNK48_15390 [Bryobacterales bacterium]|nr:hypothetical protein [Bryobacterales bacterium]
MSLFLTALLFSALAQSTEPLESSWKLHSTSAIQANLHHVQGIDIEGTTLWISSVDAKARKGYLTTIELPSGRLVKQVEVQSGDRIHPGGIALDGDSVWIPVAEYDRDGPTTIERRHKQTLAVISSFEVQDHIGCIAASASGLAGGSWSSRTIYQWTREGRQISKRANPIATHWQDLKMDGELLMGAGPTTKGAGAVEWVRLPDLSLVRRLSVGATDRGLAYTHEGMTLRGGRLYFLPEDAPTRLFEFRRR